MNDLVTTNASPMTHQAEFEMKNYAVALEHVLLKGDLSALTPGQRTAYYLKVCESMGLNPLTKPFDYTDIDGKTILYARKDCAEQLAKLHNVSHKVLEEKITEHYVRIRVQASLPNGRVEERTGAVALEKEDGEWQTASNGKKYFRGSGVWKPLRGQAYCDAIMKAETKANRRSTLAITGTGFLDETEVDDIPHPPAKPVQNLLGPPAVDPRQSKEWLDEFTVEIDACKTAEEMLIQGKHVTPQIKAQMTPEDLDRLQTYWTKKYQPLKQPKPTLTPPPAQEQTPQEPKPEESKEEKGIKKSLKQMAKEAAEEASLKADAEHTAKVPIPAPEPITEREPGDDDIPF